MFQQGDIVLVPFPFTENLEATKKRPAVVLSKNSISKNSVIIAKITSTIRNDSFTFPIFNRDIDFVIDKPSEVRTNEIMTVKNSLIIKKIGSFKRESLEKLLLIIQDNFELE